MPQFSSSNLDFCMSNAYIRRFCSTQWREYPQQTQHKLNALDLSVTQLPHVNFGGSLSTRTFLQKICPTTGRCCSLLLSVEELLTCYRLGGPFLIWPHHCSSLDQTTRAQHCHSWLFPYSTNLLYHPESAQALHMKLKLTTNAKIIVVFNKEIALFITFLLHWETKVLITHTLCRHPL